jgi:hypothetical protein
MTTHLTVVGPRTGARQFIAGWIGVALFAAAVLLVNRDPKEVGFSVVWALLAVGAIAWYRTTTGRAAVIVGLAIGALFTLEQVLFVASDLAASGTSFMTTLVDTFGLVAGLLIVVGGIAGLVGYRRAGR